MFQVHEGESELASENAMIAKFILRGLPRRPAGQVEVQVTFQIDENSILSIEARNTDASVKEQITIENSGKLTPEQMERMMKAAAESDTVNKMIEARAIFNNLREKMEVDKNKDQAKLKELVEEAKSFQGAAAKDYTDKHDDLKKRYDEL